MAVSFFFHTFAAMKQALCLLLLILLAPIVRAGNRMKYPGGKQFMYRLTLSDKKESTYRLDHPTRWLSQKSIERRRRQGIALDSTDLPVSPKYLKIINSQQNVSIVGKSRWNNTVVVHTSDT